MKVISVCPCRHISICFWSNKLNTRDGGQVWLEDPTTTEAPLNSCATTSTTTRPTSFSQQPPTAATVQLQLQKKPWKHRWSPYRGSRVSWRLVRNASVWPPSVPLANSISHSERADPRCRPGHAQRAHQLPPAGPEPNAQAAG